MRDTTSFVSPADPLAASVPARTMNVLKCYSCVSDRVVPPAIMADGAAGIARWRSDPARVVPAVADGNPNRLP